MSTSTGTGPTADVSVRIAWGDDADAIAAVQVQAWTEQYGDLLPPEALPQDAAPLAEAWRTSMTRPEDAPTRRWSGRRGVRRRRRSSR